MRMTDSYKVYWPKNRFGYSSFSDLFKNNIEVRKVPVFTNIFYGQSKIFIHNLQWFGPFFFIKDDDDIGFEFAPALYDQKKGTSKKVNNGRSIDWQYDRIPETIKESYIKQVKKLEPIEYIQNQVEEFYQKSFNKDTVSIQLRTWKDETRRQEMFDKKEYFDFFDSHKDNNFFLSSDDQEIIDEIIERYPGKAFYFPKRVSNYEPGSDDCKTIEFLQDSLIDMLLLGKSSLIVGSHLSSFVECAWWFGLCKSEVIILNQFLNKRKEN